MATLDGVGSAILTGSAHAPLVTAAYLHLCCLLCFDRSVCGSTCKGGGGESREEEPLDGVHVAANSNGTGLAGGGECPLQLGIGVVFMAAHFCEGLS